MLYFRYWNTLRQHAKGSLHNRIQNKRKRSVPGHMGDPTDRGQPNRFERWYKLPRKAHMLFWRVRGITHN